MIEMTVFDLAAGVAAGILLAAVCIAGFYRADKAGSVENTSVWTMAAMALPLLYIAATIWLAT